MTSTGLRRSLADDVVFEAPGGMRGEGKEACADFFGSWSTAFPDAHVEIHSLHIIDDVAVEEGIFTGTHAVFSATPWATSAPTGRAVSVDYVQVLRFRDGRHCSFDLMFDRLLMLEQLACIPTPASAA